MVLTLGASMGLVTAVMPRRGPWPVFVLAFALLLSGYRIAYVRQIATGTGSCLPPIADIRTIVRRGFADLLLLTLPVSGLFLVGSLGALGPVALDGVAVGSLAESLDSVLEVSRMILFIPPVVGGLVFTALLPTVVTARYAYFDRFREGLRYFDAANRAWRFRLAAKTPVLFGILSFIFLLAVREVLGRAVGDKGLQTLGNTGRWLVLGELNSERLVVLGAGVIVAVVSTCIDLIGANLVGRYGEIAYGSPVEAVPVGLISSASTRRLATSARFAR
jgi:hypothetical protein